MTFICPLVGASNVYTLTVVASDNNGSYPRSADFYRSD
jgi:hypothetical protein